MTELTFEERNLVCIYSGGGTRLGTIAALEDMRRYLEPDETELRDLTDPNRYLIFCNLCREVHPRFI